MHLLYGINHGGGFVALTGEVGTGKTTLCHYLLRKLPENIDIALILNPKLNALDDLLYKSVIAYPSYISMCLATQIIHKSVLC